jgi:hypothetical protein
LGISWGYNQAWMAGIVGYNQQKCCVNCVQWEIAWPRNHGSLTSSSEIVIFFLEVYGDISYSNIWIHGTQEICLAQELVGSRKDMGKNMLPPLISSGFPIHFTAPISLHSWLISQVLMVRCVRKTAMWHDACGNVGEVDRGQWLFLANSWKRQQKWLWENKQVCDNETSNPWINIIIYIYI